MFQVTKTYRDLPAAHRQPEHDGHCRLIHGHNWQFDITFTCEVLDDNGFVIDVGKLGSLKAKLESIFDHTLLLNEDDPEKPHFLSTIGLTTGNEGFARIIVVPNCGMEGLAKYVFEMTKAVLTSEFFYDVKRRGLIVVSVACWEDSKNRATYTEDI